MKIRIASFMLALALLSGVSVASAQTNTAQNPWAYTPMAYFWGNQATTVTNTPLPNTQVTSTNPNTALENFWAFMPMFRFFNYSR
ncbi:hypothetical protein [Fundidesulfovibrio putealis]|uniref:hypothetical protein n=1 Tax=Fundidesulfovibrio putealis TaxID=270496 RepID=UPI0004011268|nr:hypothetical protein [Fundidesulfovibrio putealis]